MINIASKYLETLRVILSEVTQTQTKISRFFSLEFPNSKSSHVNFYNAVNAQTSKEKEYPCLEVGEQSREHYKILAEAGGEG